MIPHPAPRPGPTDDASWDEGVDLRRYLSLLVRRWRPILLIAIAALGGGLVLSLRTPQMYETRAEIQLSEQSDAPYASPFSAIQVFSSDDFLTEVIGTGGAESPPELRGAIIASTIRDTQIVRIRVRHSDPARARLLAQIAVKRFHQRAAARVSERERIIREQLGEVNVQLLQVERLLRLSQETLVTLQRARPDARPGSGFAASFALDAASISQDLRERLRGSRLQLRRDLADLQFPVIIEAAAAGATPVPRRTATTLVLAGMLGLVAGGALTLLIEYLSQRPRPAVAPEPGLPPAKPGERGA